MQPLERILERFEQVSAVPRGTKQEARLRQWLQGWATERGLVSRMDAIGNLVVLLPASKGYENKPVVVLQGHMDMVWQKIAGSDHDFSRDPITVLREGDWLKADGTTLGADNGIAIALMLAVAETPGLAHPPLELLFTVEEELGMTGAINIDPGLISGRTFINLDSEDEGVFTNGCCGGWTLYIHLPVAWEPAGDGWKFFSLRMDGVRGGHSGEDINKGRANANKILGRALNEMMTAGPIRFAALRGGTVRNAIPREASAVFALPPAQVDFARQRLEAFALTAAAEYAETDPGLTFTLEEVESQGQAVTRADSGRMLNLLLALPNGVSQMTLPLDGSVDTSNNIGIMELREQEFYLVSSNRSQRASRLQESMYRVDAIAQLAGAATERTTMTNPWEAAPDSPLLKKCVEVYRTQFGAEPKVEATHGGLECGLISDRCGGLDAVSLGPTIVNAHSPDEALFIPSVEKFWKFLTGLLASF